jgi:hypothetical protein
VGAALVPFVLILVVLVVVAVAMARFAKRQEERRSAIVANSAALAYELPEGQDPAVVVAALSDEGYAASIDDRASVQPRVLIATHDEESVPDREQVRRVLAGARRLNFEGDTAELPKPKFADE